MKLSGCVQLAATRLDGTWSCRPILDDCVVVMWRSMYVLFSQERQVCQRSRGLGAVREQERQRTKKQGTKKGRGVGEGVKKQDEKGVERGRALRKAE